MSRQSPGRFNTSTLSALYLAAEPETALREFREGGNAEDVECCSMMSLNLRLHRVVDLCDALARHEVGLTESLIKADDVAACQAIATSLSGSGVEAIRWPSATGSGQCIAVYPERLAAESRIEVADVVELPDRESQDAFLRALHVLGFTSVAATAHNS